MADDRSAEVSFASVSATRMARQLLTDPRPGSGPEAVVAAMCGTHAQVMSAAELSMAVRSAAVTSAAIRSAIGDRHTLVKTLGPRGTVHLLPAAELPQWSSGLASIGCLAPGFPPDVRLDAEQQAAVVDAIGAALADAELTVDELSEEVGRRVGGWAVEPVMPAFQTLWPRWRQAMRAAAHAGALCFGTPRGRAVTYTSPARWVAGLGSVEPAEGERWLARSYLAAHGPSTPEWFAKWLNARCRAPGEPLTGSPVSSCRPRCTGWPAWIWPIEPNPSREPPSRPRSGCCPTSTSSWSPGDHARHCSRRGPPSAHWCHRARRATTRCCW